MKGGIYILITIIGLMGIAIAITLGYPYLQAKIAPLLVSGVILILAIVELARELLRTKKTQDQDKGPAKVERQAWLIEGAWMVGFCLGIYLAGFIVGIAVFTFAYAKAHKARWSVSIVVAIFMTLLSYLLFSYLVDVELYPGLIFKQSG